MSGGSGGSATRRWLRIAFRALHLGSLCGLVGGVVFAVPAARLSWWMLGTVSSGVVLVMTDLVQDKPYISEVRGMAIAVKLALLVGAAMSPPARLPLLAVVLVLSTAVSHMPGRLRHRRLWR